MGEQIGDIILRIEELNRELGEDLGIRQIDKKDIILQ